MKSCGIIAAAFALVLGLAPASAKAGDLGVVGHTFEISETDILSVIADRLRAAEREGRIDALNQEFERRVRERVERPKPTPLPYTAEPRSWLFDPSIRVDRDYSDHRGRLFARQGDRINPLERLSGFDRVMLFVDGDDRRQVDWAIEEMRRVGEHRARIVLVDGAPLELMRSRRVKVYFDQEGLLVSHFKLQQTPARIQREGDKLRIEELKPW